MLNQVTHMISIDSEKRTKVNTLFVMLNNLVLYFPIFDYVSGISHHGFPQLLRVGYLQDLLVAF